MCLAQDIMGNTAKYDDMEEGEKEENKEFKLEIKQEI